MSERPISPAAMEQILEVTRQLAAPFTLYSMLNSVIDAGRTVLDADRGTVFLYDDETKELVVSVATGMQAIRIPADRGIAGECAQTREVINVPDCYSDSRFDASTDKRTNYRTRCLLSVPLIGYDKSLVGVLQLLNKKDGVFDEQDERIAATLAAQCAVALQRVRMTEALVLKERLDRELAVAREIQVGFLPQTMPPLAGYDLAGTSRPADETGGDTFDLIPIDKQHLMLLLGDATGHGIGPALSATQVRSMLRIALRLGSSLDDAFSHINDQLVMDLADNRFVTAFLGVLDAAEHRVTYHSGGQGPLMHYRAASDEFVWLGASTMPMGFMAGVALKAPEPIRLEPGDILGLITDGVFESESPDGEMFGERGVERLVREFRDKPLSRLVDAMLDVSRAWTDDAPQADDITIVLARRQAT